MPVIPNKYDDPQFAALRANQEDPLVMYLIVRESLNMGVGKTAAQCAHGAQMIAMKVDELHSDLQEIYASGHTDVFPTEQYKKIVDNFSDWCNQSFRKVVLKADEKEWKKIKESTELDCMVVIDAGLTELEPNTETVIALFPMLKSQVPKVIKRLQVLK
jgi:peptidyl-tRNA hydrolase, PTH2 family